MTSDPAKTTKPPLPRLLRNILATGFVVAVLSIGPLTYFALYKLYRLLIHPLIAGEPG